MRASLLLAAACLALATSSAASGGANAETSLRIAFWKDGAGSTPDSVRTLRCDPAGGSLKRPALACARLDADGPRLFAAVSPKVACTQIYGGPQRARVTGLLDGRRVRATFSRSDGCQIARWQKVSPWLLPAGGVT